MEEGEGRSTRGVRVGVGWQSAGAGSGEGELREPSWAESSVVKNRGWLTLLEAGPAGPAPLKCAGLALGFI